MARNHVPGNQPPSSARRNHGQSIGAERCGDRRGRMRKSTLATHRSRSGEIPCPWWRRRGEGGECELASCPLLLSLWWYGVHFSATRGERVGPGWEPSDGNWTGWMAPRGDNALVEARRERCKPGERGAAPHLVLFRPTAREYTGNRDADAG
jgi:hypothetical protein